MDRRIILIHSWAMNGGAVTGSSALAGLLVASGVTSVAAKVQPPPLSAMSYSLFDVRVLAFSLTISVLTGLLFGVLPFFSIGQVHSFGARGSGRTRGTSIFPRKP